VRHWRKEKTKLTHVSSLSLDTEGAGQGEAGDEPGYSAATKKAELCETEKEGGFDRNSVSRKSSPEFTQRQKSKDVASPSTSTENACGNSKRAKFSPDHESEVMAAGSKSKEGVCTLPYMSVSMYMLM
jgi:hypothetical protein